MQKYIFYLIPPNFFLFFESQTTIFADQNNTKTEENIGFYKPQKHRKRGVF